MSRSRRPDDAAAPVVAYSDVRGVLGVRMCALVYVRMYMCPTHIYAWRPLGGAPGGGGEPVPPLRGVGRRSERAPKQRHGRPSAWRIAGGSAAARAAYPRSLRWILSGVRSLRGFPPDPSASSKERTSVRRR